MPAGGRLLVAVGGNNRAAGFRVMCYEGRSGTAEFARQQLRPLKQLVARKPCQVCGNAL